MAGAVVINLNQSLNPVFSWVSEAGRAWRPMSQTIFSSLALVPKPCGGAVQPGLAGVSERRGLQRVDGGLLALSAQQLGCACPSTWCWRPTGRCGCSWVPSVARPASACARWPRWRCSSSAAWWPCFGIHRLDSRHAAAMVAGAAVVAALARATC